MQRTHYQVLGVERSASSTEIEAAFRELLEAFKGRTYSGTDTIEEVREAYRVLSNVMSRSGYDETLPLERARAPARSTTPGWIKVALPFVLVAGIGGWIGYQWMKPRQVTMTVGEITRIAVADEAPDPTAPAPVTIAPPRPLEDPDVVPTAAAGRIAGSGSAEEVFAATAPSVARVLAMDASGSPASQGSGVVIGPGVVITNCHVTRNSGELTVKVGREEYRATALLSDEGRDLCQLSVAGLAAPSVPMVGVTQLKTGQRVFAIGAPQGLELTISEGIVSSLRPTPEGTVIQTSAPISAGSSGGGLFDASGRLVGIVTFQHRFGQNLNFAVPADWILEMQSRGK